ncbi:pyridoxal-phosphate dependent enzyme domain-containing protein [Phthorimaea operculella]|nr:pyridoxal-phosphate dependent enzyme domain-containing protein [Phthorimaea operculella]
MVSVSVNYPAPPMYIPQDEFLTKEEEDVVHILTFNEIKQAADRNEAGVIHTPLCEAKLSKNMDYDVYLKCENLQYTGSCAERGIRNMFVANQEELMERGAVVPSGGDRALAAAYHGASMGIPVTVVLPDRTPPAVAQRCSEFGADVVLVGETLEDVATYTRKVYDDDESASQVVVSGDNPLIIAGLGTVAMEVVTQLPELDALIVPVASGALLAGCLVACKKLKCSCLVYGAECSKVPKMMKALQCGRPVSVPLVPNIADGLNSPVVGSNAFATLKGRLDRMLEVDEAYISRAIITVLEREHMVVDGAGVCAVAAVMQGLVPELKGKRTVCILSGGNVEAGRYSRMIQRGLGSMGRLLRFALAMPDHRSGLEKVARVISEENAVLKSFATEQIWINSDVSNTWANVVVETANENHSSNIKERLRELFPSAKFALADLEERPRTRVSQ